MGTSFWCWTHPCVVVAVEIMAIAGVPSEPGSAGGLDSTSAFISRLLVPVTWWRLRVRGWFSLLMPIVSLGDSSHVLNGNSWWGPYEKWCRVFWVSRCVGLGCRVIWSFQAAAGQLGMLYGREVMKKWHPHLIHLCFSSFCCWELRWWVSPRVQFRVGDQQLVASVSHSSKGPKTNVLGSRQEGDVPWGKWAPSGSHVTPQCKQARNSNHRLVTWMWETKFL